MAKKAKKKSKPVIKSDEPVMSETPETDMVKPVGEPIQMKGDYPKANILSETPVVGGEQSTAPVVAELGKMTANVNVSDEMAAVLRPETAKVRNDEQGTPPTLPREAMTLDMPTISRPEVKKEPEPIVPAHPVICAGCKMIVDSGTVRACLNCKGSLVFCPACAKADTCHKCGKALSK